MTVVLENPVSVQTAEGVDQDQNRQRHPEHPQQQIASHEPVSGSERVELRLNSHERGFVPDGAKCRAMSHLPRNDDRKLAPVSRLRAGESDMEFSYAVRARFFPVLRDVSTSRPCERRDPYAVSSRFSIGADTFRNKQSQGLWVPAFAGTTR